MLYDKILSDIVGYRKHWDLDAVVQKNSADKNNAYIVRDIKAKKKK